MAVSKVRKPRHKKPVEARVRVVLDDDVLTALDGAVQALTVKQSELAARRERDINLALVGNVSLSPDGHVDRVGAEIAVDAAHDEELRPFRTAVDAAEKAVNEQTDVYVFRACGRYRFNELIAEHPPTDDDIEEARKASADPNARPNWSFDTFAPALIAECCIDPKLSMEEAKAICEDWNDAEVLDLFTTALGVNQTRRTGDVGKAFGLTRSAVT